MILENLHIQVRMRKKNCFKEINLLIWHSTNANTLLNKRNGGRREKHRKDYCAYRKSKFNRNDQNQIDYVLNIYSVLLLMRNH